MQNHYLATVQQGIDFLTHLSSTQYTAVTEITASSIGGHVRHILDHFQSIQRSTRVGSTWFRFVDYEIRERGGALETDIAMAIQTMHQVHNWISLLDDQELTVAVTVNADVGIGDIKLMQVPSTLGRELMFCCSHAIHHYAVLKSIYQALGGQVSPNFGLAPSTANHLRSQTCAP